MKISGFTFVRNATKLAFPFKESVSSILPIVDEFIIVYCPGDTDDNTLELIESLPSGKIKVIEAEWNPAEFYENTLYAQLTDLAKQHATGDWLFYLQGDEVIHEKYFPVIKAACEHYLMRSKVEGLLFEYKHFWGDFDHCFSHHGWYPREIRIIRNQDNIHSWRDAQSFRVYDDFKSSPEFYLKKAGTRKLNVAAIPATVYHYGWVRNPVEMRIKQNNFESTLNPNSKEQKPKTVDYGPLNKAPIFTGSHPAVMNDRIQKMEWKDDLQYSGNPNPERPKYKHEKLKYRVKSWIELNLMGGRELGGFKNYHLVDRFKG